MERGGAQFAEDGQATCGSDSTVWPMGVVGRTSVGVSHALDGAGSHVYAGNAPDLEPYVADQKAGALASGMYFTVETLTPYATANNTHPRTHSPTARGAGLKG